MPRQTLPLARVLLVGLLACVLSACGATLPRLPVQGEVQGQTLHSTVDSPLARYYIESYLAGERNNPDWDRQLDQLHSESDLIFHDHPHLRSLTKKYSPDTMALFFAQHLLNQPKNRLVQDEFEQQLLSLQTDYKPANDVTQAIKDRFRIVFVPGWLYQSKPWTGADFAGPRAILEQWGADHHFIEVLDNGTVEENAELVAQDLIPLLEDGKPIIIVSGSKGGPEVAMVLGQLLTPEQLKPVKAWINICGALEGSPLANIWTNWPSSWVAYILFRLRGYGSLEGLESMRMERSKLRSQTLRVPEDILTVNYVGVPVSGTIIEKEFEKRFTYSQLRDHGPNDGLVLIPDKVAPNSITVTELGRGHFLSEPDFDVRTTALLKAVMKRLSEPTLYTGPLPDTNP